MIWRVAKQRRCFALVLIAALARLGVGVAPLASQAHRCKDQQCWLSSLEELSAVEVSLVQRDISLVQREVQRDPAAHFALEASPSPGPTNFTLAFTGQAPETSGVRIKAVRVNGDGEVVQEIIDTLDETSTPAPDKEQKPQTRVHKVATQGVAPATFILMLAFLVGSRVSSNAFTRFIPETLCTVAVAMLLGLVIRHMIASGWITFEGFAFTDATILNLFLLPIIIFQGGWAVNIPYFMDQAPYVMIFAIFGTIFCAAIIGYTSFLLGGWGWHTLTDFRSNFAFASLISATDPVATLATFAQLKIVDRQPLLYTIVFGESMLNDAIAIILFNAVNGMDEKGWNGFEVPLVARMSILLLGSIFAGCILTSILILALRVSQLPGNTAPEILYVVLCPFFVFSTTEAMDLSGIIAVLFSGMVFKMYGSQHLSPDGEHATSHLLEMVARLADSGVFVICGTSTALLTSMEGIQYGCVALVLCLGARALMICVCTPLANLLKQQGNRVQTDAITWKHSIIVWLSGLRGGIGLVLALEIDEKWCGREQKSTIVNATFMLICSLLLLCGAATEPALLALGLSSSSSGVRKEVITEPEDVQWTSVKWIHANLQSILVGTRSRRKAEGDPPEATAHDQAALPAKG